MLTVGAFEAKTTLANLLDRVSKGEIVVITRRGVPIATLNPIAEKKLQDKMDAIQGIKELRKGSRLNGISVRELIEEGRRF
jgi:prevent-host-death family protein